MRTEIISNGHGYLADPVYLAVHSTANVGATAENHVTYWSRDDMYAVHVVSDWKEAVQCVPYDRLCYQVGFGNDTCIGIEICEAANSDDFIKGITIAADAVCEMLAALGRGPDALRSHKWFSEVYGGSDHTDPIPYFDKWNYSWEEFVNLVKGVYMGSVWTEQVANPEGGNMEAFEPLVWGWYYSKHMWDEEILNPAGEEGETAPAWQLLTWAHYHALQAERIAQECSDKLDKLLERK